MIVLTTTVFRCLYFRDKILSTLTSNHNHRIATYYLPSSRLHCTDRFAMVFLSNRMSLVLVAMLSLMAQQAPISVNAFKQTSLSLAQKRPSSSLLLFDGKPKQAYTNGRQNPLFVSGGGENGQQPSPPAYSMSARGARRSATRGRTASRARLPRSGRSSGRRPRRSCSSKVLPPKRRRPS